MKLLVLFGIIIILYLGEGAKPSKKKSSTHLKQGETSAKDVLDKVRLGATAVTEVLNFLGTLNGTEMYGKVFNISKKLGPFFEAIGPLILFISEFLPGGNTKEMDEIITLFDNVRQKFEEVFEKFNEVDNLMKKAAVAEMYSPYEQEILYKSQAAMKYAVTENKLMRLLYMDQLLEGGSNSSTDLVKATWALYYGMTTTSVFNINIPTNILKYTRYHRIKTEKSVNRISLLIMRGLYAIYTFNELTQKKEKNSVIKHYWTTNLDNIEKVKSEVNELAIANFETQYVKDVDSLLTENLPSMTNKALADKIFDFLKEKYGWKEWFVFAFTYVDMKSKRDCSNVLWREKQKDMNLMVVHVPNNIPLAFNKTSIKSHMGSFKGPVCLQKCALSVSEPYKHLPNYVLQRCTIPGLIATVGKANSYGDHYRVTNPSRLLELKFGLNGGLKIYLFG